MVSLLWSRDTKPTYTAAARVRERETDRQTDRQRQTETDRDVTLSQAKAQLGERGREGVRERERRDTKPS
jgi:hypothetical protein